MKKQFNVGDLVCFKQLGWLDSLVATKPHLRELGVVVENDIVKGCVVAFPSKTTAVSTLNIQLVK